MISTLPGTWCWDEPVLVQGRPERTIRRKVSGYSLIIEYRPEAVGLKIEYTDAMSIVRDQTSGCIKEVRRVPFTVDLDRVKGMEHLNGNERFEILRRGLVEFADTYPGNLLVPRFSYLFYEGEKTARRGAGFVGEAFDIHPLLRTQLQHTYRIPVSSRQH